MYIFYLRAIKLGLKLEKELNCKLDCFTSTICVEDELIPLSDQLEISTRQRCVSVIHIKISSI
jgi:hypothetical protein